MGVTVRIGEVVLHGFDPRDRHAIEDVLRDELARLFAGGAFAPRSEPHLDGGEVSAESVRSVDLVRDLAAAIHREVMR